MMKPARWRSRQTARSSRPAMHLMLPPAITTSRWRDTTSTAAWTMQRRATSRRAINSEQAARSPLTSQAVATRPQPSQSNLDLGNNSRIERTIVTPAVALNSFDFDDLGASKGVLQHMADGFPFIDRKADLPFALIEFMNYANQGYSCRG